MRTTIEKRKPESENYLKINHRENHTEERTIEKRES